MDNDNLEKSYDKYKLGYNKNGRKTVFNTKHIFELQDKKVVHDFMMKATGYTLAISQRTIPVAGFVHEADVTKFWDEYQNLKQANKYEQKITFNVLMLKLVAECLKAAPVLNAHMSFNALSSTGTVYYKGKVDISMPTIFPNGRMLPLIIHDVGAKNLGEIAFDISEIERKLNNTIFDLTLFDTSARRLIKSLKHGKIAQVVATGITSAIGPHRVKFPPKREEYHYRRETAHEDRITYKDVGEGTICVSDIGSIYNGRGFASTSPVLTPTTSCMAFSRVRDEQYLYKDENGEIQIGIKKILPFTLLFDHKIGGFPDVVPFLNRMDDIFEDPSIIGSW